MTKTNDVPVDAIDALTHGQQQADMHGEMVKVSRQALDEVLAYVARLATQPAAQSDGVRDKDVAKLRDHATRIFDRMNQTPWGAKRKILAGQHVDLTNEALRAEGWNECLATLRNQTKGSTDE